MESRIAAFSGPKDLEDAVMNLQRSVVEIQQSLFTAIHVVPVKPVEGMIRLADGTDWDPGSGKGLYQFLGGVWVKL